MFIKNDLLEQYEISAEQLHEDAMKSSPHALDCMTVLCDPGSKDHLLFCFPDSIAV